MTSVEEAMPTTDDLQVPSLKFGLKSVEPDPQPLETALLLVALGLAAVAGHGSPRPTAADRASEPPLERSYGAPQRGGMAHLALPSRRPRVIGPLRDRASPSATRLRRQRLLACGPVMLIVIWTDLASNCQVEVGRSAEVNSQTLQHEGVSLIETKPGADPRACRGAHHGWRGNLTELHSRRAPVTGRREIELMFGSPPSQAPVKNGGASFLAIAGWTETA